MKKCMKCGRTYDGNERFCASCGGALSEAMAAGPGAAPVFDPLRARNRIVLMTALTNMVVFSVVSCAVLWLVFISVQSGLHQENINRMVLLADNMSVKAVNSVQNGDMTELHRLLGEAISQPDVAYSFARAADGRILTSTFEHNAVPGELKGVNQLRSHMPFGVEEARIASGDRVLNVVDIAAPLANGSLGSLHIGLNADMQRAKIRQLFLPLVAVAVVFSFVATILSAILIFNVAGRILRPARRP